MTRLRQGIVLSRQVPRKADSLPVTRQSKVLRPTASAHTLLHGAAAASAPGSHTAVFRASSKVKAALPAKEVVAFFFGAADAAPRVCALCGKAAVQHASMPCGCNAVCKPCFVLGNKSAVGLNKCVSCKKEVRRFEGAGRRGAGREGQAAVCVCVHVMLWKGRARCVQRTSLAVSLA